MVLLVTCSAILNWITNDPARSETSLVVFQLLDGWLSIPQKPPHGLTGLMLSERLVAGKTQIL